MKISMTISEVPKGGILNITGDVEQKLMFLIVVIRFISFSLLCC